MAILVVVLLAASTPVSLSISASQKTILVGESFRLKLEWLALQKVELPLSPGEVAGQCCIDVLIEKDGRTEPYVESYYSTAEMTQEPLEAGQRRYWDVTLHHGYRGAITPSSRRMLAFADPGRYRVRVGYGTAQSNRISVTVRAPEGDDLAVFESLKSQDPYILKFGGSPDADALLKAYPGSRYLIPERMHRFGQALDRAEQRRHRLTGEPLRAETETDMRSIQQIEYGALAEELGRESWGAYEDWRLVMLARVAQRAGDTELARRALKRLAEVNPHSPAIPSLEGRLGPVDQEKPR